MSQPKQAGRGRKLTERGMFGREREMRAVAQLLEGVAVDPSVLLLTGEAGIGKTTVWRAAIEEARTRGFTILICQPAATEVRLSYAGLSDLLSEVGEEPFARLPPPQRRALDAALLRGEDDDLAPDPRAVAAGFLSILDRLANAAPVLVALDDIQWLDNPTRRVVEFAMRRTSGAIATLAAWREGEGSVDGLRPRDPERLHAVALSPLTLGALHHVVRRQLGRSIPRPHLVRIAQVSGGNPFFALELARSLQSRSAHAPTSHAVSSFVPMLPDSLRELVLARLEALPPRVREALLVSSALASPRVELVARAMEDAATLLEVAEDAGLIELAVNGAVRFTHPLLAAGVYTEASPSVRRALHRQLSALVDDAEERARHLALAAVGAGPETIKALDTAALQARRRGAPAAAAELLELAIGLGADDASRYVQVAQDHFHTGNPARAQQLLEVAIDDLDAGHVRARALELLGTIRFEVDADAAALSLLAQALIEAEGDARLRCSIALELNYMLFDSGQPAKSIPYAMRAVEEAERGGDDGLLAEALAVLVLVRFFLGEGVDEVTLARALALEDPNRRSRAINWPTLMAAMIYQGRYQLDEARRAYDAARQRCLDQGVEGELWYVSLHAMPVAYWAGDIDAANHYLNDLVGYAEIVGTDKSHAIAYGSQAELWAWVGRIGEARVAGEKALELYSGDAAAVFAPIVLGVLGMAELSIGDYPAAAARLAPTTERVASMGLGGDASNFFSFFLPDTVEALIALGRLTEAEPLIDRLESSGRQPSNVWARAVGARCRGLLLAVQGQPEESHAAFARALAAHDRLPQLRYDRARTLLLVGQQQRRRNQRRAAWAALEEAARLFDEVGTAQWARLTRAQLSRVGLRVGPSDKLTPTEQHIAELAASGMTNQEMAKVLFISPKTVEAHLTRVYGKLGIHSRAELGKLMAERQRP